MLLGRGRPSFYAFKFCRRWNISLTALLTSMPTSIKLILLLDFDSVVNYCIYKSIKASTDAGYLILPKTGAEISVKFNWQSRRQFLSTLAYLSHFQSSSSSSSTTPAADGKNDEKTTRTVTGQGQGKMKKRTLTDLPCCLWWIVKNLLIGFSPNNKDFA